MLRSFQINKKPVLDKRSAICNPGVVNNPCVGCGFCCQQAKCALGTLTYGASEGACPGLTWIDGRYWCYPLMMAEDDVRPRLSQALAIGAGCSSPLFNTQRDEAIKRQMVDTIRRESK